MTTTEVALTAAFGSSFLTAAASLGVIWLQQHLRRRADAKAALHGAVLEVLSRSLSVATRSRAMGETMKIRSGLVEGLDIALHHRKPTDPMELHDWLAQDLTPLNTALADIWTRWDQEGVRLANDVVSKSMDLMGASLARQPASTTRERLRRWAAGERWTPEMLADHDKALKKLAYARKELADHARGNLGLGPVDLFAQVPDEDAQTDVDSRSQPTEELTAPQPEALVSAPSNGHAPTAR